MKIKTIALPSIKKRPRKKNTATDNRFIRLESNKPYIDQAAVEQVLYSYPTPIIRMKNANNEPGPKQSGIKNFLKDRFKGFSFFAKALNLNSDTKVSEEKIEKYFLDAVSVYFYKEKGKWPSKQEETNINPEDIEDPNDMPPIDKGLSELNLTKEDFKI
jgi:hypothetical protein